MSMSLLKIQKRLPVVVSLSLLGLLSLSANAQFDWPLPGRSVVPGDSVPRELPPCGPIFKNDLDNARAVCGSSQNTDGVYGESKFRNGVVGIGGVAGVSAAWRRLPRPPAMPARTIAT